MYTSDIGQRQQITTGISNEPVNARPQAAQATRAEVSPGPKQLDAAKLSPAASQLASVMTSGQDVRMEKVQQLKLAIEGGTYAVSSGDLADKLIQHMSGKAG